MPPTRPLVSAIKSVLIRVQTIEQARPFYEGHGYHVFGSLDDYPAGHTCYFLTKELSGSTSTE